jgi:hypothetical protein
MLAFSRVAEFILHSGSWLRGILIFLKRISNNSSLAGGEAFSRANAVHPCRKMTRASKFLR